MARSVWKGAIAFGLVHVPVAMYPASQESEVDFDWLDKRSLDPVGYKRINKRTGKEVTKDRIVKGVAQDDGRYVVLSDDEVDAPSVGESNVVDLAELLRNSLGPQRKAPRKAVAQKASRAAAAPAAKKKARA